MRTAVTGGYENNGAIRRFVDGGASSRISPVFLQRALHAALAGRIPFHLRGSVMRCRSARYESQPDPDSLTAPTRPPDSRSFGDAPVFFGGAPWCGATGRRCGCGARWRSACRQPSPMSDDRCKRFLLALVPLAAPVDELEAEQRKRPRWRAEARCTAFAAPCRCPGYPRLPAWPLTAPYYAAAPPTGR